MCDELVALRGSRIGLINRYDKVRDFERTGQVSLYQKWTNTWELDYGR